MGVKGLMIGGTLSLAFAVAVFESCSDNFRNEAAPDRDKSTQFFGDTGRNFVENTAAFVEDGVEALIDYSDKKLRDIPKEVNKPDCDDVRNMALLRECWEVEP